MSTSRHPIAYRLEQLVDGPTRLLATVMALPLVDGIFPALILAEVGAGTASSLDALWIVETGLLIFGGSATMAVILAEMDGSRREQVVSILVLAVFLLPIAALEAAMAETIQSLIDLADFKRFAALVILAIAAKTASSKVGEMLPSPGAIIGLGLLASVSPAGATFAVKADPMLMMRAASAAGVGIVFALGVALTGPQLRGRVDIDRFRFGSAVALGVLGLSVLELGIVGTEHPVALGVLLVTAIFSYDPDGTAPGETETDEDDDSDAGDTADGDGTDGDSGSADSDVADSDTADSTDDESADEKTEVDPDVPAPTEAPEKVPERPNGVVADGNRSTVSNGSTASNGSTVSNGSAASNGSATANESVDADETGGATDHDGPPTAAIDPVDDTESSTGDDDADGDSDDESSRAPWL